MKDGYRIKEFDGDFEELIDFFRLSTSIRWGDDAIKKLIAIERVKGSRCWVGEKEGKILGFVVLYRDEMEAVRGLYPAEIMDVAVLEEARRSGLGKALVAKACEVVQEFGDPMIWVMTFGHDFGALAFYESCGFELVSILPDGFGPGDPKAFFRRWLTSR